MAISTSASILITGASTGIGAACVTIAAKHGLKVFATARSKNKLDELKQIYPSIITIIADISTQTGCGVIADSIDRPLNYVLHNAALLQAPEPFEAMQRITFGYYMATNVEPIIFLTQKLLPMLKKSNKNARILSMSSGAAKQGIAGIGNYCISKAAALMATQYLKSELDKYGVLVNNYFPGVVDTAMQKSLRSSNSTIFPHTDEFKKLKTENKLSQPQEVAKDIINCFIELDYHTFENTKLSYQSNK